MASSATAKCEHCKKDLPAGHKGPCPYCGKLGKNVRVIVTDTVGITASVNGSHKPKWSSESLALFFGFVAIFLAVVFPGILMLLPFSLGINYGISIVFSVVAAYAFWWQRYRVLMLIRWVEARFGGEKTFGGSSQNTGQMMRSEGQPKPSRDELIELYKTTLEEMRHQETIYVQAFIGLSLLIPVFLTAVSFLFGRDLNLNSEYVSWVKDGVFSLALALGVFFLVVILRIDGRFKVCRQVAKQIENMLLPVANSKEILENDRVLIRRELDRSQFDIRVGKYRLYGYLIIGMVAFVAFWFFLFRIID